MVPEFKELTDDIFGFLMRSDPVWATNLGVHDYDGMLPSLDPERRQARSSRLRDFATKLEDIRKNNNLTPDESLDCDVLLGLIRGDLVEEEQYRRWERDPFYPMQLALAGCFMLYSRDSLPAAERFSALTERLKQVPVLLREAAANLQRQGEVATVWAEMAEDAVQSALAFFGGAIPDAGPSAASAKKELEKACQIAVRGCIEYLAFLQQNLTSRSAGSYAIGGEQFDSLLKTLHGLPYSGDDLVQLGEEAISGITTEMDLLADEIAPGTSRQEIVAELKHRSPADQDLLDTYRSEIAQSRDFVVEHDLVGIPKRDRLDVEETPEFSRPMYPFAAYVPPAPFEENHRGVFWVTPIAGDGPDEVKAEQRRGHNRYSIKLIAPHEAYPGHHLQMTSAAALNSRVRRLASSTLYAEGWALYCEEMLGEQGYFADKETRLMQLLHQLWRACRVVIDVKLHSGEMTFTEAVARLVEVVNLDRFNAIAEIKRYTYSPTQPMSYYIGKLELLRLRDAYKKRQGDKFRLREFHDRFLSYGTIPISLVARSMLEQKL